MKTRLYYHIHTLSLSLHNEILNATKARTRSNTFHISTETSCLSETVPLAPTLALTPSFPSKLSFFFSFHWNSGLKYLSRAHAPSPLTTIVLYGSRLSMEVRTELPGRIPCVHAILVCVSHSVMSAWLFVIPWTVACHAPLPMRFSRWQYGSGLAFPSPGDLPDPGIEPGSPILQVDSLPSETLGGHTYTKKKKSLFTWIQI